MSADLPIDRVGPVRTESVDRDAGPGAAERARLATLAAEFEAMLLTQMLRDMRRAGSWKEEGDSTTTFGAEAFFETLDAELARHLASVQGFGLADEMVRAWTARQGGTAADLTLPPGAVTSPFGWRADPIDGLARFHGGVDIRAAYGEDVAAAGPGRVVFSGEQGGYGITVVVDHGSGVQTRYAHLSDALVRAGDDVQAGQLLGRIGQSGRATGPHLHFEVTAGGRRVDPAAVPGLNPGRILADLTHQSTAPEEPHGPGASR